MPYRIHADPNAADNEALARELESVAVESIRRRRNAAIGVALACSTFFAGLLLLPALQGSQRQQLHCRRVELRYEDAPEIPGQVWRDCRWR